MAKRAFFSFCLLIWKPKTKERNSEGTSSKTVALRLQALQREMMSEIWLVEALDSPQGLVEGASKSTKLGGTSEICSEIIITVC